MLPTTEHTLFDRARAALDADRPDEALAMLNDLIARFPHEHDLLFWRGKTLWRLGRRDLATNDYAAAAEIRPDGPAARALEHARDIASFFNPDLLNP